MLTTDVEQVREEEGLLVEVLYGEDNGAVQAAPQGLLGAALVCDERLEHGPHHVQLEKERRAGQGLALHPGEGCFVLHLHIYFLKMPL